ncbi:MAG: biotin--[acetyl-CoA-carboxylase] ligase [Bacteroidota bacterium]
MYKILANTIFLGKDVFFLPECHSTNDIAMQCLRQGTLGEGSIVITDFQTQGKGQRGNTWETNPGENLTFSLVLRPKFLEIGAQVFLNMAIANAIRSCISKYIPQIQVKWPNDLVVAHCGKLGGILIENILSGTSWDYAIVGIGINVNQRQFGAPQATSMSLLTEKQFALSDLLQELIHHIESAYLALKNGYMEEITQQYLDHLYLYKELARYTVDQQEVEGKIVGLSNSGDLYLELLDGTLKSFGIKEIKFPNF